jgi:hypothetical protein
MAVSKLETLFRNRGPPREIIVDLSDEVQLIDQWA